ncbi:probable transcription factor E2F8 [Coccomyxa sp. Obi]|nr:probable transcription factor E2F8 [Coccomyxa sp. Obi]
MSEIISQEEESLQSSGQVPTRKRSLRPRCPRTQLEETYYLSPLDSQSLDDGDLSDESAEDEEAAALLLEMGLMTDPTAENKAFFQQPGSTKAGQNRQQASVPFRCTSCRQPAVLRGEKRPTFFCASCPSKGGAQKRAQRALHGNNGRLVSVTEASELLAARSGAALQPRMQVQQQRACPPIFQAMAPAQEPQARCMERLASGPVHNRGVDPDWVPSQLTRASSEGTDANQGRCKCGKRISAAHPPCKSELMLLCEKFQARFGRPQASPALILLNEAAIELAVPRRRLYDIINVLEAVEIVTRTGKLAYEWKGLKHLPQLLDRLVADQLAGIPVEDRLRRTAPAKSAAAAAGSSEEGSGGDEAAAKERAVPPTHSLWMLSRKFVRLLLTTQGPIPLADAAVALIGVDVAAARRAQAQITVERRLYDIGSILSSVGLIEKTYLGKRQPAFSWKWPWRSSLPDSAADRAPPAALKINGHANSNTSSGTLVDAHQGSAQGQNAADDARCLTPSSAATGGEGAKRAWAAADAADAGAAGRLAKRAKPSEAAPAAHVPALSYNVTSAAMTQQAAVSHLLAQPLPPMSMPAFAWSQGMQLPGASMPLHLLAASYMAFPHSHPDVAAMWASLPDEQHFTAALHPTAYLPMHVSAAALAPPALPFPLPAQLTLPAIGTSQR